MIKDRAGAMLLAERHGDVLSRGLLAPFGFDRDAIAREVSGLRWAMHGRRTVALHRGPLSETARRWLAVWEVGERVARLDGVTALQQAGLERYDEEQIHLSVTRNSRCPKVDGVRIHRLRPLPGDAHPSGIPRVKPEIAAVRAAHWAVSDRQALLILVMTVQQRLTTGPRLLAATQLVKGRNRRRLIAGAALDIADGAQSLGELDFAGLCRRHGLPEPDRQVVRPGPKGRIYLDVRWDHSLLVVEIDGAGHRFGLQVTADNLRQNEFALSGDRVLRIDTLGLRLESDTFMRQVALGLVRFRVLGRTS